MCSYVIFLKYTYFKFGSVCQFKKITNTYHHKIKKTWEVYFLLNLHRIQSNAFGKKISYREKYPFDVELYMGKKHSPLKGIGRCINSNT